MRSHFSGSIVGAIAAAGVGAVISVCLTPARAQTPEASAIAAASILRTPWGEPDLQGIWTDEFDTPFQRPARFANQEYFTEAQREELDKERSSLLSATMNARNVAPKLTLPVPTTEYSCP